MIASLLIISADDFPNALSRHLEQSEFSCYYSRGVIKTREILENQQIDAVVWLFMGHESALAKDLVKVLNLHAQVPIVLITQNYDQLDFAENIKYLFANLDLNDDLSDMIKTIETVCNQSIIKELKPDIDVQSTNEIEFKNAVSQIIGRNSVDNHTDTEGQQNRLNRVELWEAIDANEKQILAGSGDREKNKKTFIPKIKQLFKKS
ncbi:hypothetical protein KJ966_17090 [bacterium]|nr:hypothetical protein [bacterium]